ncbi:hypothetical protein [Flavobacterium limnophilum]|uniref:hypothetical protein n=1 Tax=Flavobacterium limnophilum TaxID=3003262 RepID=UPI0022AC0A1B|nr:hypothetical protein [Flavobacterium limnophilum]
MQKNNQVIVAFCAIVNWCPDGLGKQFIGTGQFGGGFENALLYPASALTQTTPDVAKWSYDSVNLSTSTIASGVNACSGSKYVNFINIGTSTGKYIVSPVLSPALSGGDGVALGSNYTVQYY